MDALSDGVPQIQFNRYWIFVPRTKYVRTQSPACLERGQLSVTVFIQKEMPRVFVYSCLNFSACLPGRSFLLAQKFSMFYSAPVKVKFPWKLLLACQAIEGKIPLA